MNRQQIPAGGEFQVSEGAALTPFDCRTGSLIRPSRLSRPSRSRPTTLRTELAAGRLRPGRGLGEAFTLLELLVAVTITLVLAGLMLAVVTNTLGLWHRTQDIASTGTQAKLTLDLLARDLQAAVFRKDGGTWLAVDVINSAPALTTHGWLVAPGPIKPGTAESQRLLPEAPAGSTPFIGAARFGLSGAWLRLVTTNVESGGTLPVAAGWQIARRPVSGSISAGNQAEVGYTLFRAAVSPENTFASGNEMTAPAYASASITPAAPRGAMTLANPNGTDAIATNVVDFGVWLYVRDDAGSLRRIFPRDENDLVHAAHDDGAAPEASRFPDAADLMVRILTGQGAVMLAEMESGRSRIARPAAYSSDAEWWWGIVEANSRVYTRRVEIKGGAL